MPTLERRPKLRRTHLVPLVALGFGALAGALYCAQLLFVDRHRIAPHPDGMVLRIEVPKVQPLIGYRVVPSPSGGSLVATLPSYSSVVADQVFDIAYPAGAVRRSEVPGGSRPTLDVAPVPFDLDGDGVLDRLEVGGRDGLLLGLVRVRSGADGRVLFEDQDVLEYEGDDRAFSLGDLDGDGFGELALVYPRRSRTYDTEHVLDALFETHGWIAVVSGARLFGAESDRNLPGSR